MRRLFAYAPGQHRPLVLMLALFSALTFADEHEAAPWAWSSSANPPHAAIRVLDTDAMPIGYSRQSRASWGVRSLYENPETGGRLSIVSIPPGAEGALNHYHEFHEWAWIVSGDFTNNESTSPDQVYGPLQRFVAGDFLSRPPFSLHGGERGRQKFMASQLGSEILIMEEAEVGAQTWKVDPACRNGEDPEGECMGYNPDYRKITHWSTPRIIDTINDMPFQPVPEAPGLHVKHLLDDAQHGFRARMWYLEAGVKTPSMLRGHFYRQAHQFNFLISGDLRILTWADGNSIPESRALMRNFYFERPPMSILGIAPIAATERGAVWIEVTYAKGTAWSYEVEPSRIEAPTFIDD